MKKVIATSAYAFFDLCTLHSWWPSHPWPYSHGICFSEHNSLWCGDSCDTDSKALLAFPFLLVHAFTQARPSCHPLPRLQGYCITPLLRQKREEEYHFSLFLSAFSGLFWLIHHSYLDIFSLPLPRLSKDTCGLWSWAFGWFLNWNVGSPGCLYQPHKACDL